MKDLDNKSDLKKTSSKSKLSMNTKDSTAVSKKKNTTTPVLSTTTKSKKTSKAKTASKKNSTNKNSAKKSSVKKPTIKKAVIKRVKTVVNNSGFDQVIDLNNQNFPKHPEHIWPD